MVRGDAPDPRLTRGRPGPTRESIAMDIRTHIGIDARLCGTPTSLEPGAATVEFVATPDMAADGHGLVHGGFVFGLADHAAMLAVNEPTVVLGGAEAVRFKAPVAVGDTVVASARVTASSGRKHTIDAQALVGDEVVFTATFTAFVLDEHVLSKR